MLAIALLLFGKRLPEVARNLGRGITEFKGGLRDLDSEVQK
ncbi:MAG: twin-arginine translocase TatA/TatE family subunit [Planctomycetaceae bacterium]